MQARHAEWQALQQAPQSLLYHYIYEALMHQHEQHVDLQEQGILRGVQPLIMQGTAARSGDPAVDVAKARALGSALVPFLVVPWTCSLLIYTGLSRSGHPNPRSTPATPYLQCAVRTRPCGVLETKTSLCADKLRIHVHSSKTVFGLYKKLIVSV